MLYMLNMCFYPSALQKSYLGSLAVPEAFEIIINRIQFDKTFNESGDEDVITCN